MAASNGVTFELARAPYTNNGASPWYLNMRFGSAGQVMRVNIDSGANIVWLTSTLCGDSCQHYADGYFDYAKSKTFQFLDCLQRPYSFGAWGTMQVETGSDTLALPTGQDMLVNMFLSANYAGDQFLQLEWDGGIGLPCSSAYVEGVSSFLFLEMLKAGYIDPRLPYASLDCDAPNKTGTFQFGGVDPSKADGNGIFLPWSVYTSYPNQENIWTSKIESVFLGSDEIQPGLPKQFDLDTGSSLFKGDDDVMNQILALLPTAPPYPEFTINFQAKQSIHIPSSIYMVRIEAGPDIGQVNPQFQAIGTPNLVYVGSVLHDYCYSIFRYEVVKCPNTGYSLAPLGVYLFNKPGGPKIISGGLVPVPGAVEPTEGRTVLLPQVEFEKGWTPSPAV
jgi:hypothetical protein